MLGLYCKLPLNVTLRGVTSNNIDPSVDVMKTSIMQTLKKFIFDDDDLQLKICKRGKYY